MKGNVTDIKTGLMKMTKQRMKRSADVGSAVSKKSNNSKHKKKVTIASSASKLSESDDDEEPITNINTVSGASEWLTQFRAQSRR